MFPSFGFLLATTQPTPTCEAFTRRGLQAAVCGSFDDTAASLRLDERPRGTSTRRPHRAIAIG